MEEGEREEESKGLTAVRILSHWVEVSLCSTQALDWLEEYHLHYRAICFTQSPLIQTFVHLCLVCTQLLSQVWLFTTP